MYIRYNQTHIKPHFTLYSKATIKIRALLLAIAMLVPLWAASTQAAASGGTLDDQQSVNDSLAAAAETNVIDSTGAPLASGGHTVDTEDTDITTDDEDSDNVPDYDRDDRDDSDEGVLYETGSDKETMGINVDDEKADTEEEITPRETKKGGKDDDNDNTRELILGIGLLVLAGFVVWHNVHPMETTRTAAHTSDGQPTLPPATRIPKATPTKAPKATPKKKRLRLLPLSRPQSTYSM